MVDVGLKSHGPRAALYHQYKGINLVGAAFIKSDDLIGELGHQRVNVALFEASVSKSSCVNNIHIVLGTFLLKDGIGATLKGIADREMFFF